MTLTIRPLTPDLWPAFEDLFGKRGACNGCWCMWPRIGRAYHGNAAGNKRAFRAIVKAGPPPGLLAFDGDVCVGWCQLTPRAAVPWLDRVHHLKRVDEVPVWSISCFYTRIGHRRQGISTALTRATMKIAKQAKAPALEVYPFDRALSPSSTSTGFASTFRRLGFKVIARRIPARPIMRHDLKRISR
jgi:hypothetical protein